MKLNIKNKCNIFLRLFAGLVLISCDDFLDREPLDIVTPEQYFNTEADLEAYSISYYNFPTHGSWSLGTLLLDDATDNQTTGGANFSLYVKDNWKVPQSQGEWHFAKIRACNNFLDRVLPKHEEGLISGDKINIDHYIGEMYFLRAEEYFKRLTLFGDFPIITHALIDKHEELMEASKRRPRNEVARFILQDLDKSISMLKPDFKNKNRLTSNAALLLKSRVALFEASFLSYHKGTPRVPGESNWPGAQMDYNAAYSVDIDAEIEFFLNQTMDASKQVADNISLTSNSGQINPLGTAFSGWNPYFEMFASSDMGTYSEVLFWRSYHKDFISHAVSTYIRIGGNNGLTKGFVDGFLMKNGLPIYAPNSNYAGDITLMKVRQDRDERLQLFVPGEDDPQTLDEKAELKDQKFGVPNVIAALENRTTTGYRVRKCLTYDPQQATVTGENSTYGSIVYRGVEAYLNYIEACYMKTGAIDTKADEYWQKIRTRAGIDPDYNKTIAATDLSKENDWAKYSASTLVDRTLFNIRRERRNELMSEGRRMNDLLRWRAMDMVKDYVIEGFNLWDEAYKAPIYNNDGVSLLISDGSSNANVSSSSASKYLRPFQKVAGNQVHNGYNWSKANYLYPVGVRDLQLASPDQNNASESTIYQNPYWPISPGSAIE
ncbi:membrane protein [Bacteroidales bacterium]|nr:membrane protein [Bacteroidales bacterium]